MRIGGRPAAEVFLGIGHLHRGQWSDQLQWRRAQMRLRPRPRSRWRWGFNYSHFLYALDSEPPHRVIATSGEFCVASSRGQACESIQMIMGLVRYDAARLMLSYGVDDCEARIGLLPLATAEAMLVPV